MKKYKIFSNSGFALTELMATVLLTSIVFIGASLTLHAFFTKFSELQKISELNREAFRCIQVLKHGIKLEYEEKTQLLGIVNANEIELSGNYTGAGRSGIIVYPPIENDLSATANTVEYYYSNGYVRYRTQVLGAMNSSSSSNYIFPSKTRKGKQDIEVTSLMFSHGDPEYIGDCKIVKVRLEARVKLSPSKYHYADYETYIAIGKM